MLAQVINRRNALQNKEKNGFTMIELIVVMAILVIIIGVFAVVIANNAESAQDKSTASAAAQAVQSAGADVAAASGTTYELVTALNFTPQMALEAHGNMPSNLAAATAPDGTTSKLFLEPPLESGATFYLTTTGTVVASKTAPTDAVAISGVGA